MAVRYLHVIHSLDPERGGPAEAVRQLAAAAVRMQHQPEILTLDPPDAPWAAHADCPVHCAGPSHFNYGYAPGLDDWLRTNASRFDAVVVSGIWQYHSLAVWRALRGTPTPYLVYTHGMLDPWFRRHYPLKHLKKLAYWTCVEQRVLRDARAVLFTSEEERVLARQSFRRYQANEIVVHYGTPGPGGDPETQRETFLRRFPTLRDRRVLLFLGRLHPKKGCDLLIEAFAEVASNDPSLRLVIAGPDQVGLQPQLAERARRLGVSEAVVWAGMLRGEEKAGAFHAAEAFVLPSHQENFGIAVAEALACGVPALISDKVNIWREVVADQAGFVAEDTLAGTRQLLRRWLGLDQSERQRMSRNAAECFQRRFHIDAAAQSLIAALQSAPGAARQQVVA